MLKIEGILLICLLLLGINDLSKMKFILEFFVLITGLGAASGLSYKDDKLYIVSDNSNYLYEYHIPSHKLDRHLLLDMDGQNEQVQKKDKLDIEAIAMHQEGIYLLFSSGSKPNRSLVFDVNPDDLSYIGKNENKETYGNLREHLHIGEDDFNIEGAVFYDNGLLLFNRGNGPNEMNGIIKLVEKDGKTIPTFIPIKLPEINGQTAGFTDATLVEDKIYFLAAAEGGNSSYEDGKVSGSQIGIINAGDLTLEKTETISDKHKFEGITLYHSTAEEHIFLLCDDPDNDVHESTIYQLKVKR
ncbi:hypothetical protein SAMN05660206_101210 [Sphingobacterium wenxiniae]|uniref:Uncharacterized protein n=2 Tax=Sphingobacterium wenxiniae TaxID=683125 RepID=A0A1I6P0C6_9SPHI|nr:hypothetical protein SAMN05660206_101210 [Sphingobacterium wenxiniae]